MWFIVITKKLFFWTYLWQLKEYHIGRLLDHFYTHKGKKIFLNYLNLAKIICVPGLIFFSSVFVNILCLVFLIETYLAIFRFFKKSLCLPVLTKKTIIILVFGISLVIFVFWRQRELVFLDPQRSFLILLLFDLFAPFLFSLLALSFQPFILIWKKRLFVKAKEKRERLKNLIVIGITGSYGKTSTKEFLATILSEKFNVLKTEKNQNSDIGISQCVLNSLNDRHNVFVCEIGAYRRGDIRLMADIIQPRIGILTGINEQHMATFGSQENIIKTKLELIDSLPEDGTAILNWDNQLIQNAKLKMQNKDSRFKITKCSVSEQVQGLEVKKESIFFKINGVKFNLGLIGKQNVINFLMAAYTARELGMNLKEIARAGEKIKTFRRTMELKQGRDGVTIINDTYSANPQGVLAGLDYLKLYSGKKIIVMPCLIELGKASERVHKKIGEKIGQICDLSVITTKDKFSKLKQEAVRVGMKSENILFIENPKKIFEKIEPYLSQDNVVLLESRVPQKLINMLFKI